MRPAAPTPETFQGAIRGDDAAWSALHRQWAGPVLSWCSYLGGGRIDPDEAARDVFFRLWQTISRIRSPEVFSAFLYSITRRVISEHRRRAWLRRWVGEPAAEQIDTARSPHELTASREIAQGVQAALESMRPRDREIIVMCDVQGYTTAEAAGLLGIQPNTAKSRLLRARSRFEAAATRRDLTPSEPVDA